MKKFYLSAASMLGLVSCASYAATNVDLYGTVNITVQKKGSNQVEMRPAEYTYASNVGIRGQEELGHGISAIFNLEAELQPDNGTGTAGVSGTDFAFNNASWVGLLTPIGAFRVGRSSTPAVNMWIGGKFAPGRGVGEVTGGLLGAGLDGDTPDTASYWNNALFYDMELNGVAAGLAVTTKGSQSANPAIGTVSNEGTTGKKLAYGGYARYEKTFGQSTFKLGADYQRDNASLFATSANGLNATSTGKDSWIFAAGYGYGPVMLTGGFARANFDNTALDASPTASLRTGRSLTKFIGLKGKLSASDSAYVSYGQYKLTNNFDAGILNPNLPTFAAQQNFKATQWSLGYEHSLSKRTVLYADFRNIDKKKAEAANQCTGNSPYAQAAICDASPGGVKDTIAGKLNDEAGFSWDVGLSHSF